MNAWNPNVRQKAELILKVRAGLMSATEAAAELGISRKTYYKWERRALEAMVEGLCERIPGRPHGGSDTEKEELERRIRKLEKELERRDRAERLRELVKQLPEKKE
jgi:transposase